MKKHKLVLIFGENSEVDGVDKVLIFNNQLDAETSLLATGKIFNLKIDLNDNIFYFKTLYWSGTGRTYWATDKS